MFRDFLTPQVLEKINSKINGQITVQKYQGKIYVYAGGTQQSSPWVKKVWRKALNELTIQKCNNILILGLGAGIAAQLVTEKWPDANITGVEVDPVMIEMGSKYFGLSRVPNLTIFCEDALNVVAKRQNKFGFILVDLYIGSSFPKNFESDEFLYNLSQTLTNKGIVVFNRLATNHSKFILKDFEKILESYFKVQKTLKADFNTLVYCSRL